MRVLNQDRVAAGPRKIARAAMFTALFLAGCSRSPLPLAPEASTPRSPRTQATVAAASAVPKGLVVVTIQNGADVDAMARDHGASVWNHAHWRVAALLPGPGQSGADLVAGLAGDARAVSAEEDHPVECAEARQQSSSFDDGLGSPQTCQAQPALAHIGVLSAQAVSIGSGVRVAILDTGAEVGHSMLSGRVVGTWDFVNEDADVSEQADGIDNDGDGRVDEALGHGTHVAGVVRQVAPGAQLLIARVLNSDGVGDMLDVARAIRWSVASGARVINLSLGSLTYSAAVQLALDEAAAARVVVVASAGNWAAHDPQEYPATATSVFAVGALDDQGLAAPFTSYGNFVSFAAPGVAIRSAFINNGYAQWSGTSMSAPFVAGGAALLLSLHPDWSPSDIRQRLAATAHTVDQPVYRNQFGAGALDLGAALQVEYGSVSGIISGSFN
jgi:hypothetical protein